MTLKVSSKRVWIIYFASRWLIRGDTVQLGTLFPSPSHLPLKKFSYTNVETFWTETSDHMLCVVPGILWTVRALSKSRNWPVGRSKEQIFWQWNSLFPRGFTEKPSPLCIIFRIWLIWMVNFDEKWNSHWDGNWLAAQFRQMESALRFATERCYY